MIGTCLTKTNWGATIENQQYLQRRTVSTKRKDFDLAFGVIINYNIKILISFNNVV